ncbi:MAG TPA: DUF4214 domain-containing protein [Pseudomonas sp.]|jgi:hypothetical protein|uniref:beta strand repeat-containing protein n=1 Tax=Pseudomonas sp. TaxID=306 RepID=UPI002EDA30E8
MSTQTDLAELYTTFFNRAPDAAGLDYWVNEISTGQLTLAQVAQNWTTQQPEGLASFPSSLTDAEFVEKIYGNILGRASDADGAQYWLDQLADGTLSRDSFAITLINGAKANTSAQGVLDSTLISNKATAGVAFADKGLNDTTLAAKVLTSVTADANSLAGTLAILSLIPSATADQSAAVLASTSQLLTSLANLIATAPGEVADAATYLHALATGATGTTNIVTLFDNASTLLNSASTNPAALDNPAAQGAVAVVVATPSTGGETPTFSVNTDLGGELTFSGTATGAITITIDDSTHVTFLRGGVSTASTALSSNTVINLPNDAVTINAEIATTLSTLGVKFAANDAVTVADIGPNLASLIFANYQSPAFGGSSVVFNATNNAVTLIKTQADALLASGLTFAANDVITVSGIGEALAALTFANYTTTALGGSSVVLDASDNLATLTVEQADLLLDSDLTFAANDVITVSGIGEALAGLTFANYTITELGGSSVVLDASDNAVTLVVEQADSLLASGLTFAGDDVITLSGAGTALAALTFANYTTTALGGGSVVLDAFDNAVTLTVGQANLLLTSGLTFATNDVITVSGAGTALAALTFANYATTELGGDSVTLNASDNAIALTNTQATALIASTLKFAANDAVTITVDNANVDIALTSYTKAAVGGSSVTLDAAANAWNVSAEDLSAASQAGIVLAGADTVTITNTLIQGDQVISAGFQTLNDKLSFVGDELFSATGYTSYQGVDTKVTVSGFTAKLLVGAGAIADEEGAAFLFDTTSHVLSYDADGSGTEAAIPLLTLTGVTSLSNTDFVVSSVTVVP